MLRDALESINNLYRRHTTILCLLTAVAVLAVDYVTGRYIQFPIIYALPVGMAAWRRKKAAAYGTGVFLPFARVVFYFPWHEAQSLSIAAYNALINICALLLYAYLVDRIARQTKTLKKKMRVLEGILPICASCKRIRTDKGEYEQMEKFITEHSEASFSHGICPECAEKLYPDHFTDKNK
jgi:hypothetical protein